MTKRTIGRITLRDQMLRNQRSMDLYADLAEKPRVQIAGIPPAPVPRQPAQPSGVPLEADVQREIIRGLRRHPKIGLIERVNSGSALEQNADGSKRYIEFHRVYPVAGVHFSAPDLHCTMRNSGKRFVIEVKRPGWKAPRTPREFKQWAYIRRVQACGGHGMFATSWDDVSAALADIAD